MHNFEYTVKISVPGATLLDAEELLEDILNSEFDSWEITERPVSG